MPAEQSDFQAADQPSESYEPPELLEVGDVVELTNGHRFDDTADMKRYYY